MEVELDMPDRLESTMETTDIVIPAATLELQDGSDASDEGFASSNLAVKAILDDLEVGQVLLVRANDHSLYIDVPGWCALTGNVLQATSFEEGGAIDFFIKKGRRRRWAVD